MPFAIAAVPFDAYRDLPTVQHRWVAICLARYADKNGVCWPSIRQLAADARMSKSSVQRYLADLSQLGVFSRDRRPGGRYRYVVAPAYCPGLPRVPARGTAVPQRGRQEAYPAKHETIPSEISQWEARLRTWQSSGGRFWPAFAGPRPDEPGCWAPASMFHVKHADAVNFSKN